MKKIVAAIPLLLFSVACAFITACSNDIRISFQVNGGIEIADLLKQPGEEYTLPIPEKSGYAFEGWYLTEDLSGAPVETATATERVTYYASWAQLYPITLNLDGGTLAETNLSLKAGANVYDYMANYVPVKNGFTFGAWYNGDTELKSNTKMTESGITLTAKYKVAYSVEIYKQNVEGTEYVKDDEATLSGTDYVGVKVAPEKIITGFDQVENASSVSSLTLTENASQNVLKLYFDRKEFLVNFTSNYPDGSANEVKSVSAKYGAAMVLPVDFTFEGYCLKGYSTSQNGASEYNVNYAATVLYNKDDAEVEPATFYPERNMALYAVWSKGYTDLFGGNDYIYLLDDTSDTVYLARGGVFFEGEYDYLTNPETGATYRGFTIRNSSEIIEGVLNDDGTFCYKNTSRVRTYYLYKTGSTVTVDKETSVSLNEENLLTYSYPEETETGKQTVSSTGRYQIVDGMLKVRFFSGKLADTEAFMSLGSASGEYVFRIRNEKEVAMGSILRIGMDAEGNVGQFREGYYSVKLDGFGSATLSTPSGDSSYPYEMSEDKTTISLKGSFGMELYALKLMTLEGFSGYMIYTAKEDMTITQNGGSLTLDGICRATYVNNGKTVNGYYFSRSMPMGGTLINIVADGASFNVLITSTTKQEMIDGEPQTTTVYSFAEKPANYEEYYYSDQDGIYYFFLVLDDEAAGKASIYRMVAKNTYAKAATGSYVYDEASHWYTFTKEEYFEIEGAPASVVDMSTVKSFIFRTGVESSESSLGITTNYNVNYWIRYTAGDDTVENAIVYTAENGATLSLVVGKFAIYSNAEINASGVYTLNKGLLSFTLADGSSFYFRVNDEDKTFVALVTAPSSAYESQPDGTYNRKQYLYFDGTETNAIYYYLNGEETVTVEGTFVKTDRLTEFGYYIFTFTSLDGQMKFDFIRMATSSASFFAKSNSEYNGEYESVDDGILALDGFNFMAEYKSPNGYNYSGIYSIPEENVIVLRLTNTSLMLYFDLGENKTFKLRGTEYGVYLVMDNKNSEGVFLELGGDMADGVGTAKLYTSATENGQTVLSYIDEHAAYSRFNGLYTVKYTQDGVEKTIVGKLMLYTTSSGSFSAFVIIHDEVVNTYVNEKDYSILILDNSGSAVKYNSRGIKEEGTYTLITDNILSYVNNAANNAYIYVYDAQKGTAHTVAFEETAYYANNLQTLNFNRYGVATFNGETSVYYSLDENRKITIYRLPEEGETAEVNRFGFITEEFGSLSDVKEYKGNTYYKNSGYDLSFSRVEETKNDYPVLVSSEYDGDVLIEYKYPLKELVFSPTGKLEFTTSGTVKIVDENDKTSDIYNCTVVRELVDGEMKTYITLPLRMGYYRFDIKLNFNGEDQNKSLSTYEVLSMTRIIEFPSYSYLYMQVMYGMLDSILGTNYAENFENTVGTICIKYDYTKDGKVVGAVYDPETNDLLYVKDENGKNTNQYVDDGGYITATFGEDSGLFDADGNLLHIEHGKYTVEKQSGSTMYTVEFEGDDGYMYCLRFIYAQVAQGVYGYRLYGMTRVQTFEYEDYTVKVERVIGSDVTNLYRGGFMSIELKKGDEEIEMSFAVINADGSVDYIHRTYGEGEEENTILSSIYYTLTFKEKISGTVGDEDDGRIIPVYESVTVKEYAVTTVYSEDGKSYVDMAESEIKLLNVDGRTYIVAQTEYDETTGVYTATVRISATENNYYTVEIKDGKAIISLAEDESGNEENA